MRATVDGGVLWRPAECAAPGYANTRIPARPRLDAAGTSALRRVPSALLNIRDYTEPVTYPRLDTPVRRVRCTVHPCVGGDQVPLTGDEVVAGGTDAQLVVLDLARHRSYELWRVEREDDGTVRLSPDGSVAAGSMSVLDLDGRGDTTVTGEAPTVTGSGLSRMLGLVRAHEVEAARDRPRAAIPHALEVSLPAATNCRGTFRPPATKSDGQGRPPCVLQGSRLQLDPSYDCSGLELPMAQAVCVALQRYGAFVTDNGGENMQVYAQHEDSWPGGGRAYARAGIDGDYQDLGLPMDRMRVLRAWTG